MSPVQLRTAAQSGQETERSEAAKSKSSGERGGQRENRMKRKACAREGRIQMQREERRENAAKKKTEVEQTETEAEKKKRGCRQGR